MQEALEQVVEFLETKGLSYTRVDQVVVWPQQGPNDFPIVFSEGVYPGWVFAIFCFGYRPEEGPSSVEGLRTLRKALQDKYGGRIEVQCEGREFTIVGRLRSDPTRLKGEIEDYLAACNEIFTLLCTAIRIGQWKLEWNGLALTPAVGTA